MRTATLFLLTATGLVFATSTYADDWPQWLGPKRDAVWRETGIVETFPADGPRIRWRREIGAGYAGPAVAEGRVYITDRKLPEGANNPKDPFDRSTIPGSERLLCLDEKDGHIVWQYAYDCPYTVSYPAGPRATPAVSEGKVYGLGTEGNLFCLEAATGKVLWSRELKKDYNIKTPLWGFAGHPLIDGPNLICLVGGTNSVVVTFDKNTGRELWRALTAKEPGYCPPVIYEAAGRRQLIVWHPQALNALDPETGKVLWSVPGNIRQGVTIAMPRKLGNLLLVSSFYNGSMMLEFDAAEPTAKVLWQTEKPSEKETKHLNSLMCTPFLHDGHIYGVCNQGQLRCLNAQTGERIWQDLTLLTDGKEAHCGNAFIVKNGDRYFLFNENGDLIMARLDPSGPKEISRYHLLDATASFAGREIVWSHPAFAHRCVFARNDKEIVCADLAAEKRATP